LEINSQNKNFSPYSFELVKNFLKLKIINNMGVKVVGNFLLVSELGSGQFG